MNEFNHYNPNGFNASQNVIGNEIDYSNGIRDEGEAVPEVDQLTTTVENRNEMKTEDLTLRDMSGKGQQDSDEDFVDGHRGCGEAKIAGKSFVETSDDYRKYAKPVELFLKKINGSTSTIKDLTLHSPVKDLEREASCLTNIPVGQFRLTSEGKNLSDPTKLLSDYGMRNHSNVYMTGRLRGGFQCDLILDHDRSIIGIINMLDSIIIRGQGL